MASGNTIFATMDPKRHDSLVQLNASERQLHQGGSERDTERQAKSLQSGSESLDQEERNKSKRQGGKRTQEERKRNMYNFRAGVHYLEMLEPKRVETQTPANEKPRQGSLRATAPPFVPNSSSSHERQLASLSIEEFMRQRLTAPKDDTKQWNNARFERTEIRKPSVYRQEPPNATGPPFRGSTLRPTASSFVSAAAQPKGTTNRDSMS